MSIFDRPANYDQRFYNEPPHRRVEPIAPSNPTQNQEPGHVSDIPKHHKAVRVDNLMYKGCELHWKCIRCGECVPKHCYTKEQFEAQECQGRHKADG